MADTYATYGTLPSYRAMLDREGAVNPSGAAIVGDESSVAEQIAHLERIGVTQLGVSLTGSSSEMDRTMRLLRELVASR
jgi:alkanesulfonate monooxygenase SsuD/methylene tetrahydromethanopterin reductase-like flavin-dependent oxidoreductase (luciferase family)